MPYFWRRRWRRRPYRYRNYRPRYSRFYRSRRPRRTFRRKWRRRRYRRVRHKKKRLILTQWQPQCIRKCKIKGKTPVIICGEGRQQFNFTQHRYTMVPSKMAGGGSFAHLVWNLAFLYEEHKDWRNFWTHPNEGLDLGRYTGTTIKVWRPPTVDVCLMYTTSYPMLTNMGTHPACHPQRILLAFKRIIIESQKRVPNKKKYKKFKIKPPQLMQNKWFFQKDLANLNLFQMYIATCDLDRPYCSVQGDNNCIGFFSLNTNIFKNTSWKKTGTAWQPDGVNYLYGNVKEGTTWKMYLLDPRKPYGKLNPFFKTYLQGTFKVYTNTQKTVTSDEGIASSEHPNNNYKLVELVTYCRYNPLPDEGDGNFLYLLTMLRQDYNLSPSTNYQFKLTDLPLWLLTFGFYDWMSKLHKGYNILWDYVTCISSEWIFSEIQLPKDPVTKQPVYIPLGSYFMNGVGLFNTDIPPLEQTDWVVRSSNQSPVLNDFVKSGPYVPSPYREDSWCVELQYTSYFKWGGTAPPQQDIVDPAKQSTYPVPSDLAQRLQVKDPRKQKELHPWNFRRDIITKRALKRIKEDTETETDSDSFSEPEKKRSKSDPKTYLGGDLYSDQETSTDSEGSQKSEETSEIQHTIEHQRKQQQRLRRQLYRVLLQLRKRQRHLSILTGPIE
nr:MAG: ORF1 [Torque teno midi virus]